jgi:hypothetical protein
MTNSTRRLIAAVVVMVGLITVSKSIDGVERGAEELSRVRSTSPVIRRLLQQGLEHSPTFRGLSEKISATNGLVFVEAGKCSRGVRACVTSLTTAGSKWIVWIRVDASRSDAEVLESIAHELQHAVEVLSEATAVNNATLYMTLSRIGIRRDNGVFETAEAVRVGMIVRDEVARSAGRR